MVHSGGDCGKRCGECGWWCIVMIVGGGVVIVVSGE